MDVVAASHKASNTPWIDHPGRHPDGKLTLRTALGCIRNYVMGRGPGLSDAQLVEARAVVGDAIRRGVLSIEELDEYVKSVDNKMPCELNGKVYKYDNDTHYKLLYELFSRIPG